MSHFFVGQAVTCVTCLCVVCFASSVARGSRIESGGKQDDSMVIEQAVIDAAMEKLRLRQQQRSASAPTTRPASSDEVDLTNEPYSVEWVTQRKLEVLRAYDQRVTSARAALRQKLIPASDVRRICAERSAFTRLSIERCRELMIEVDEQNAQRLQRFQEAFGDLPTAAKTVSIVLMKSGRIDFATALPEDPLTREVEESHGVRRVYFQFYLNPPAGTPRRHNGYVEFLYDPTSALWVPTWCDYSGEPMPLFDAEAFVPLRPYRILYNGSDFVVAQAAPIQPPEVFTLLTPRWTLVAGVFGPGPGRW